MQRLFDIVFAGLGLLLLSPLLVPIVCLLRFTGEGEVFFMQERVGKGGAVFGLYKFATMLKNSPSMGTGTVTLKNDPRILPFGGWMRRTKINELPQLLNILKGDMSVIGPRPQTRRCFEAFPSGAQRAIVRVRPGLSGVGSIIFRGEEDLMDGHENPSAFYDDVIAPFKGCVEEWYVANQGLKTYFLLIFLTVWVVLVPRSNAAWRALRALPEPNPALERMLRGRGASELARAEGHKVSLVGEEDPGRPSAEAATPAGRAVNRSAVSSSEGTPSAEKRKLSDVEPIEV